MASQPTDVGFWTEMLKEQGLANTIVLAFAVGLLGFAWKVFFPLLREFLKAKTHESRVIAEHMPRLAKRVDDIAEETDEIGGIGKQVNEIHAKVVRGDK